MGSKVSMVMSCYNKEAYVGATLQSMYDQDWDNIEFVLINNGSTDGSLSILREWEKKLLGKGFEVVLIDQENQGLPGAILTGMKMMSGEYFCTVDADDEIYPEYVSTMAGWLDEHPDYEWASCGYELVYNRFTGEPRSAYENNPAIPGEPPVVENLLLMRNPRVVWRYLIRISYIEKCRVLENFATEPRISHEPQITIPLTAGEGKIKYFPQPLLKYNQEIGMVFPTSFDRALVIETEMLILIKKTIDTLKVSEFIKKRWKLLGEICCYEMVSWRLKLLGDDRERITEFCGSYAELINKAFDPCPGIRGGDIEKDPAMFLRTVNMIITEGAKSSDMPPVTGRVIGYGALGKVAGRLVPSLLGTDFAPTELWDKSAGENSMLCDIPVTRPKLNSLRENDVLLVFPKNEAVIAEVKEYLNAEGIKCRAMYYDDISEMWPAMLFPQLFNGCKLIY